jgi:hypothetical protein
MTSGWNALLHVADDTIGLPGSLVLDRRAGAEHLERRIALDILFGADILLNGAVHLGDRNAGVLELGSGLLVFRGESCKRREARARVRQNISFGVRRYGFTSASITLCKARDPVLAVEEAKQLN